MEGMMAQKGIQCVAVLLSEIYGSKLEQFELKEIGCFVQIGCPRLSIDWGPDLLREHEIPILNAYEATVALEEMEWQRVYPMDNYRSNGGIWSNYYMTEDERKRKEAVRKERRRQLRKQRLLQKANVNSKHLTHSKAFTRKLCELLSMEDHEMQDITSFNESEGHQLSEQIYSSVESVKSKLLAKLETSKGFIVEDPNTAVNVMDAFSTIIQNRMNELQTQLLADIQSRFSMIPSIQQIKIESEQQYTELQERTEEVFALKAEREAIKDQMKEIQKETEEKFKSLIFNLRKLKEEVVNVQHDQSQSTSSLNECDDEDTESEEYDVVPSEEQRVENGTGFTEQEIESVEEYHSSSNMEMDADDSDDTCLGSADVPSFDCGLVSEIAASSNNEGNNAQNQSKTSITPKSNIETNSTLNDESYTVDDDETISVNNFSIIPITTDSILESTHLLSEDTIISDGNPTKSRQPRRRSLRLKKKKRNQQEVVQMEQSSHSESTLNNNRNNSRSQSRVQCSKREKVQKRRHPARTTNQEDANGQRGSQNDARPYRCGQCGKTFKSRGSRYNHIQRVHRKKVCHRCTYCQKGLYYKSHLIKHIRTHTGEKPFQCDICNKSFSRKDYLKTHKRIHSGERPFHCKTCNKSFSQSGALKKHKRTHSGEKPFHCNSCNKSFSVRSNLIVHQRIHSGIKPYQCSKCHKRFNQSSNKNQHERKCKK